MEQTVTSTLETTIKGVNGFKVAGVHCGLRNRNALDLAIVASDRDCTAAGIFTTNQVKSAHVRYDIAQLANNPNLIRAVVTNSKIANVCTGEQGDQNTARMAALVAEQLGCQPSQVLVMSTGIIGAQLPMHKVEKGIQMAAHELAGDQAAWDRAATGIMTTDTVQKIAFVQGDGYVIAGIAKGSGMIAPNMATMLSCIVTDAAIPSNILQAALRKIGNLTFNRITVDGDTSTSDTVLLLANGSSGKTIKGGAELADFEAKLEQVCQYLAKAIVRDGEGATKFISIEVLGAPDDLSAWQIANTIATSPLVKTAFAGSDANWGRIMMAAGRAGVPFDQNKANLWFDYGGEGVTPKALQVLQDGTPTNYLETDASDIFAAPDISLRLQLGEGEGRSMVWTCDLSHEYVSINADYRS